MSGIGRGVGRGREGGREGRKEGGDGEMRVGGEATLYQWMCLKSSFFFQSLWREMDIFNEGFLDVFLS